VAQGYDRPLTRTGTPAQQRQALGYIPARAAAAASGGGVEVSGGDAPVISLEASGVTPGTYGDATNVAQVTFDAFGRATTAAAVPITFPVGVAVTFGTGAPASPGVTEGDLYFDTTLATYVGFVWHSAAWNQF